MLSVYDVTNVVYAGTKLNTSDALEYSTSVLSCMKMFIECVGVIHVPARVWECVNNAVELTKIVQLANAENNAAVAHFACDILSYWYAEFTSAIMPA